MNRFVGLVVLTAAFAAPVGMSAQVKRLPPPVTEQGSVEAAPITPDMLTKTVHETWVDSGRNEQKFFQVVEGMAQMSAQKRGITLPNTEAAGQQLGTLIKTMARRDPDQLLYAVVDAAVRQIGGQGRTGVTGGHVQPVPSTQPPQGSAQPM